MKKGSDKEKRRASPVPHLPSLPFFPLELIHPLPLHAQRQFQPRDGPFVRSLLTITLLLTSQLVVPFRKRYPWEVLLLVLAQADRSTLAALAAVSLDFLGPACKLLYGDVMISSVEQMELLFCERSEERVSFLQLPPLPEIISTALIF